MLLGVLAIGAESGGRTPVGRERVGRRGRVRLGRVVDGSCWTKSSQHVIRKHKVASQDGRCTTPECSEAQDGEEHTRNGSATEELDGRNTLSVSGSLAEDSGGGEHGCDFEGWVCWRWETVTTVTRVGLHSEAEAGKLVVCRLDRLTNFLVF